MSSNGNKKSVDFSAVINHGNLLTRRAFTNYLKLHLDRIGLLVRITNKGRSTCEQYCYETSEFGSGIPSPLHIHQECIREIYGIECEEGLVGGISFAQEMAEAPLNFLNQLRKKTQAAITGARVGESASDILDLLINEAALSNLRLKGRRLDGVPLGELKELHKFALNMATLAREYEQMIGEQIGETDASYTGSPYPVERKVG